MHAKRTNKEQGFSLVEAVVVVGIMGVIVTALYFFIARGYDLNRREANQILAQEHARQAVETIKPEVRQADDAVTGSYVIDTATATEFIYYSDVDSDGTTERVRYTLAGSTLQRGIVEPAGSPLSYDLGTETVTDIASDVVDPNVFAFYDSTFDGMGSPLFAPVDVTDVRLVGVTISVDAVPGQEPDAFTLSERVQLRNLKDNL